MANLNASAPSAHPQIPSLLNALQARYALSPTPAWLTHFLSTTRHPLPPLPALTQTAHFRLLASDLTTTISTTNPTILFPPGIDDVTTKELHITGPIPIQVLDIHDIGSSKWAQVEAIERVERGEEVRGREVIRMVAVLDDDDDEEPEERGRRPPNRAGPTANPNASTAQQQSASTKRTNGPHKLIVQDAAGTKAVAFELESGIPRLFIGSAANNNNSGSEINGDATAAAAVAGMSIGCKMVLQPGVVVRRGMIMLTPATVRVLGGKIEPWDRKWREDRKKRLIEEVAGEQGQQETGTSRRGD